MIKLRFNGVYDVDTTLMNCCDCGVSYTFVRTQRYTLPSGISKTFRVGDPVTVNTVDAQYLLAQRTEWNGHMRPVFDYIP